MSTSSDMSKRCTIDCSSSGSVPPMSVVTISLCFSANKHEGAASMNEDDKRINNNLNKELRLIMDNKIDDKKIFICY